jgi:hypothetical protein
VLRARRIHGSATPEAGGDRIGPGRRYEELSLSERQRSACFQDDGRPQDLDLPGRRLPGDWLEVGMHEPFAGHRRLGAPDDDSSAPPPDVDSGAPGRRQ